jgi:hypothetical protein
MQPHARHLVVLRNMQLSHHGAPHRQWSVGGAGSGVIGPPVMLGLITT